jgi:hypothetical protein
MTKLQRLLLWVLFALCCADVLTYVTISVIVGDVSRGAAINGHFYFKHYSELVEVNKSGYRFAQILMISSCVTFPGIFLIWKILRNATGYWVYWWPFNKRDGNRKSPRSSADVSH